MPTILGLNAYHGDSSAAVLIDGQLVSAAEEERFNRIKHWAGLPVLAAERCLSMASVTQVDHVAVSRNPRAHLGRKIAHAVRHPAKAAHAFTRAANSVRITGMKRALTDAGLQGVRDAQLHFVEHHRAHLASAFFASPFEEAAVISIDGFGDFSSVMWGIGSGNKIRVAGCTHFPHSLGLFYTAFTQFLGFDKYGDEYKMMGLAAYGAPTYVKQVRDVVCTENDQVRLNLKYFVHHSKSVAMTWQGGEPELGAVYSQTFVDHFGEPRAARSEISQRHMDLAASAQAVLEENYFRILNFVQQQTRQRAVCLAGGVALNCVANGKVLEKTLFKDIYVQPAAHDAGTSIGAALYVHHQVLERPRSFHMRHVYYGPSYPADAISAALNSYGLLFSRLDESELVSRTADEIADGKIVGWFQGAMEFGPRALGNRSILADPRRSDMKDTLNRRIKFREPFRPFCPSILSERTSEFFECSYSSPFMVMAYKIKSERQHSIPAVTHADGTGRLQMVERDANPLYWSLLDAFAQRTGIPVLLNTSFNENEPIVDTPEQAIDCFLRTQMDVLAIGRYFVLKSQNQSALSKLAIRSSVASGSFQPAIA